mgnify:CR=1 FL=1
MIISTLAYRKTSMKVNILPFAIALMPDARLFRLMWMSNSLSDGIWNINFYSFYKRFFLTYQHIELVERMRCMLCPHRVDGHADSELSCWWLDNFYPKLPKRGIYEHWNGRGWINNNFTIFEIKFMEIHSFDKVAHRLWFECSQVWITNFPKQQFN